MVVTVLGASGRTGRHIVRLLARGGYQVRAGLRNRRRGEAIAGLRAQPVIADLTADPAGLVDAFTGADAVINAAGAAGPDPSAVHMIDRDGAIAAIRAAELAGVRRYLQVSSMFADAPDQGDRLVRSILLAKQVSDTALRRSSLTWTVVRPGTLTDEPGTGRVTIAAHLRPGRVTRVDLAAVVVAALSEPATENCGFDLHAGDMPIRVALATFR
jgi:uncharacterized protein YbjT (DUF2867 family)